MESGRFLLAVVLMIAVMVVTNILFRPSRPAPASVPADSVVRVDAPPTGTDDVPASDSPGTPRAAPPPVLDTTTRATIPAAPNVTLADTLQLADSLVRLGFSPDGALISATLLEYEAVGEDVAEGTLVELAPPEGDGLVRPRLRIGEQTIDVPFRPATADSARARQLRFIFRDGGRQAVLTWTLEPNTYLVHAHLETSGFAQTPQLLLELPPSLRINEADPNEDRRSLAYVFNSPREGIESVRLSSVDEERAENGPFSWVAIKNKYFVVAAMVEDGAVPFGGVRARPTGREDAADIVATLPASAGGTFAFDLYLGPQEADRLAAFGNALEDVNPYGWSLFRPILRPIGHFVTWALVGLHNTLGVGYGWVLILFGVLVRVVLWPLNARSMRAQLKNMELQPRIKEIQEKYRNNPELMQKEMMKLYKEGFNPLGGCLPMLIPFPVLIALFFVFQSTIEFRGVEFLWLPDLSRFDPLYVLPVLLGATMFLQQWITAKSTPSHMANPQMKMMMYFMPVFMTVIFLRFASGLNLYYVAQNVASIPQQFQLMRERKAWHAAKK